MVRKISIILPEEVHKKFKSKCHFYGISMSYVLQEMAAQFSMTDTLDERFQLPTHTRMKDDE